MVSRIIQLVDPASNIAQGGPIIEAPIGQLVQTTIQIVVVDYSNSIQIVDPFPGALEPLDDSIYNINNQYPSQPYLSWYYYYGAFSQKQFLQDKVVFTGFNVYPGTYSVQYYSLVSTSGIFVLPPTIAYDLLQPEIMGSTAGGTFSTPAYVNGSIVDMGVCLPWVDRSVPSDLLPPFLTNSTSILSGSAPSSTSLSIGLGVGLGIGIPALIAVSALLYYKFIYHTVVDPSVQPTVVTEL